MRIYDGDSNGTAIVDIGCYEFASHPSAVGIDEILEDVFEIKLYPNPADQNVFIDYYLEASTDVKIIIFDLSGKIMKETQRIKGIKGQNIRELYISSLPKGLYIVQMHMGKNPEYAKLLIK